MAYGAVKAQSGTNYFSVYYGGRFEGDALLGINFRPSYLDLGGNLKIAGEGNGWSLNVGGAYAHVIKDGLRIEGAAGLYYGHSSLSSRVKVGTETKYMGVGSNRKPYTVDKYETVTYSSGGVGFYVTPRLIYTYKGYGVFVGYEFRAFKFKFDHFGDSGYVTLGLVMDF